MKVLIHTKENTVVVFQRFIYDSFKYRKGKYISGLRYNNLKIIISIKCLKLKTRPLEVGIHYTCTHVFLKKKKIFNLIKNMSIYYEQLFTFLCFPLYLIDSITARSRSIQYILSDDSSTTK